LPLDPGVLFVLTIRHVPIAKPKRERGNDGEPRDDRLERAGLRFSHTGSRSRHRASRAYPVPGAMCFAPAGSHEEAGGDLRGRVWRSSRGARVEVGAGRRHAHRSAQLSPFPAAFVPGRHRLSLARRHRRAPAQRLQPPEERTRAARGGRRRRSRIEADPARGRCRISVRRADRRRRFTELVLRARRLAAVGAQLEERGRGDQHPAQDPALEEEVPGSNDYAQARILPAAFWISTPLPSSKTITARVHGPMAICVSGCASNERETSR